MFVGVFVLWIVWVSSVLIVSVDRCVVFVGF